MSGKRVVEGVGHNWILKVLKSNRARTITEHTATQNTSLDNLIQRVLNKEYENGLPRIAEMILQAADPIHAKTKKDPPTRRVF
jgi:hypothetical protein